MEIAPQARVVVAIPTLRADSSLDACLASLEKQAYRDFHVVVIDNSGHNVTRRLGALNFTLTRIENARNIGFGAAINQAAAQTQSDYIATLNDDCEASPQWLKTMVDALDREYEIGSCAAQVRMAGSIPEQLDSAGMLITADGSSKQRGFRRPISAFQRDSETLCCSGSASLYRRAMFEELGGFDETFFLYCEDIDLGLRARWAGWQSWYAANAIVYHRYSHSAGQSSALKASLVERNRLRTIIKNFPARELLLSPAASVGRYLFHGVTMFGGKGHAAEFRREGGSPFTLFGFVLKAHWKIMREWPSLWRARKSVRRRMTTQQMRRALRRHKISLWNVASQ